MNLTDLLKGKSVNIKTDVGVIVQLEIESAEECKYSEDLEPSTAANDWWPASRDWTMIAIKFTNGHRKEYNSLSEIDLADKLPV